MSIIRGLKTRLRQISSGQYTLGEFLASYVDRTILSLTGRNSNLFARVRSRRALGYSFLPYAKDEVSYHIKDIRLPLTDKYTEYYLMHSVLEDTLWSYMYYDDSYDEETFDRCDKFLGEGLYGLVNDRVNVTVKPGDVVIDAGAWIGDFAAYASVKGAQVYAFEPSDENFAYLTKTAEFHKNIIPVRRGLSHENTSMSFFIHTAGNTGANSFNNLKEDKNYREASSSVETVRLDDFVRENNLSRIDFIKSDIEGFERHMLAGAQETLRRFAPKLALCTYHLPDDPQVMANLILKANPKYNIVQKKSKLFASVP